MIRKRQQHIAMLLAMLDGALLMGAYVLSTWLWLTVWKHDHVNMAASAASLPVAAVYAALVVLIQSLMGGYDSNRPHSLRRRIPVCWGAHLLGVLCGMSIMYLFRLSEFSRGVLGLFYVSGCILLSLRQVAADGIKRFRYRKGQGRYHVVVIGTGSTAIGYHRSLQEHP